MKKDYIIFYAVLLLVLSVISYTLYEGIKYGKIGPLLIVCAIVFATLYTTSKVGKYNKGY